MAPSVSAIPNRPDRAAAGTADLRTPVRLLDPSLPWRTIALGALGSVLMLGGSFGAGGTLVSDPLLGSGPLSAWRFGHGRDLATAVVYTGFALLVWAWVRLGRGVLAHLVNAQAVLTAAAAWITPMLVAAPLFTRDVYSYLGQGLLALHGLDPYLLGPSALTGPIPENVHPTWMTTPAPYGPLFIGLAQVLVLLAGEHVIAAVIATRLVLLCGLVLLVCALPGLVRHLGGRLPVALWLAVASPMTVVQLVGGPHNDLLVVGLLAGGTLLVLNGRHGSGIAVVTLAMAVKATAGLALPFLVWVWAGRLTGPRWERFARAVLPALSIFAAVFGAVMLLTQTGLGWIPALSAPGLIVNYLSLPTAFGQFLHSLASIFTAAPLGPFVGAGRFIGVLVLIAFGGWNWWQARDGGGEAVRRAAMVLFAAALLSPTVLPWYLTWGMALACALPWAPRAMSWVVGGTVLLTLAYYPDGEQAMYNGPFVAVSIAAALLAASSLLRYDPLGLRPALRSLTPSR